MKIDYGKVSQTTERIKNSAEVNLKSYVNREYKALIADMAQCKGEYSDSIREELETERMAVAAAADFMIKLQRMMQSSAASFRELDGAYKNGAGMSGTLVNLSAGLLQSSDHILPEETGMHRQIGTSGPGMENALQGFRDLLIHGGVVSGGGNADPGSWWFNNEETAGRNRSGSTPGAAERVLEVGEAVGNSTLNRENANITQIGFISAKYETGGFNPGMISSGKGDFGGVSYGIPQFATNTGSADAFVTWLKEEDPEMGAYFKEYGAGTEEFSNAWKQTADEYGDKFGYMQTNYEYETVIVKLVDKAKQEYGIDYERSPALRELIYSTGIQFHCGELGLSALGDVNATMTDREIIDASYDKKIANYKSYFQGSDVDVQEDVKQRFINERKDVLALLNE